MIFSLDTYVEESKETISKLRGFKNFIADLKYGAKGPRKITDNIIVKNLLANCYGDVANCDLCIHFRRYYMARVFLTEKPIPSKVAA